PSRSTLFPYTTLFRSGRRVCAAASAGGSAPGCRSGKRGRAPACICHQGKSNRPAIADREEAVHSFCLLAKNCVFGVRLLAADNPDRKSTRLNSSHSQI